MMVASMTPSAVSWLYYANRLIELPLGVVGIAIGTVLVPAFSHANRAADRAASVAAQSRGLELAVGLSFPAALGLAVLARPIVTILFEHGAFTSTDTIATASAVAVLALGLPGHVLVKACSPAFFAREDTSTPMRAALIGLAVAGLASLALFRVLGPLGIASAIALSGWAGAIALAFFLRRRIGFELDRAARRRLPLIVLASVAMAAGLIAALPLAAPFLAQARPLAVRGAMLGGLMAGGFVFYFGLLRLFGVLTFRQLVAAVNGEAQTPLA
jgi:putative peptidoglycan lipid II flippase